MSPHGRKVYRPQKQTLAVQLRVGRSVGLDTVKKVNIQANSL